MKTTLNRPELASYVARQMNAMFPDSAPDAHALAQPVSEALERLDHCFAQARIKYFFDGEQSVFNHRNTDQYAMFLYFLSNSVFRRGGDSRIAETAYALNKALHSIDVFFEVQLPDVFVFQHPVGTVLGRAKYADFFFVYQRCSVGSSLEGKQPRFGEGVVMFGGSVVIGDCTVGDNSWFSVGSSVMDRDVPAGSVVFGQSPNHVVKATSRDVKRDMFGLAEG